MFFHKWALSNTLTKPTTANTNSCPHLSTWQYGRNERNQLQELCTLLTDIKYGVKGRCFHNFEFNEKIYKSPIKPLRTCVFYKRSKGHEMLQYKESTFSPGECNETTPGTTRASPPLRTTLLSPWGSCLRWPRAGGHSSQSQGTGLGRPLLHSCCPLQQCCPSTTPGFVADQTKGTMATQIAAERKTSPPNRHVYRRLRTKAAREKECPLADDRTASDRNRCALPTWRADRKEAFSRVPTAWNASLLDSLRAGGRMRRRRERKHAKEPCECEQLSPQNSCSHRPHTKWQGSAVLLRWGDDDEVP